MNSSRYCDAAAMNESIRCDLSGWESVFSGSDQCWYFGTSVTTIIAIGAALTASSRRQSIKLLGCNHPAVIEAVTVVACSLSIDVTVLGTPTDSLKGLVNGFFADRKEDDTFLLIAPTGHWLTGELLPVTTQLELIESVGIRNVILDSAQTFATKIFTNDLWVRPNCFMEVYSLSKFAGSKTPMAFAKLRSDEGISKILAVMDPISCPLSGNRWTPGNTKDVYAARQADNILRLLADQAVVNGRTKCLRDNHAILTSLAPPKGGEAALDYMTQPHIDAIFTFRFHEPDAADRISERLQKSKFKFSDLRRSTDEDRFLRLSCPIVPFTSEDVDALSSALLQN